MATILRGAPVTAALTEKMIKDVAELKAWGIAPCMCILRVGERVDDLSYEKSAMKRAEAVGVRVVNRVLAPDVSQEDFDKVLEELNEDTTIHGILMFRPLPSQLDDERARRMIAPFKDIDGCTDGSLAGVFTGSDLGFPPCTAQAVVELLHYYKIPIKGKKVCVIGRSLVIGRPVAMMLMHEDATVVSCHTKTVAPWEIAKDADILICAAGKLHSVDERYIKSDQVIVDVGINWDEERGSISGDCDFEKVEPLVRAITPVPNGVGGVTSAVLIAHVVEAAKRSMKSMTYDEKQGGR